MTSTLSGFCCCQDVESHSICLVANQNKGISSMEYQPTSITVDEPFLSQQAFRDFLKLPSEESAIKIGLHDLLEVAKVVIRDELVACGCSENELTGFQLKCKVSQIGNKNLAEDYTVEWHHSPQEVSENNQEVWKKLSEENLGEKFINNLFTRIREMVVDSKMLAASAEDALKISTVMNFSSGRSLHDEEDCDPDCPLIDGGKKQNSLYRWENGTKKLVKKCIGTYCYIVPSEKPL